MRNVEHNKKLTSILVLITFAVMIAVNILANIVPFNNITTGDVSGKYANLFAPISFTFSIWIVIYVLIGMYSIYQFKLNVRRPENNDRVIRKVNTYFIIVNIANALWIVCWHYDLIPLSMVFMVLILLMLISIRINITHRSNLSKSEKTSIQIPFSVYFGWITVATIANLITLLVYLDWDGFAYGESLITVVFLVIGLAVAVATVLSFKDIPYGLVIIWAYIGILYKHISPDYYNRMYNNIIITLIVSIVIMVLAIGFILFTRKPRRRRR